MINKHKVLIVGSEQDLKNALCGTVVLSKNVVREWINDIRLAPDRISRFQPHLIIIGWPEDPVLLKIIFSMRHQDSSNKAGIVVLSRSLAAETEKKLIHAGVNLILPVPVQPGLWNSYLKQLLNVTPRFNTRIGVTFALWSVNLSEDRSECQGISLNISISGMLIQTRKELHAGSKLDIRFTLPGQDCEINVVGQIMWSSRDSAELFRSGIQFIVMRNDARGRIASFIDSVMPATSGPECSSGLRLSDETAEWERELRISEARKMAILEASSEAVISVDATGHILEFNAAAEAIFGCRRSEVLGKLLIDTVVPDAYKDALHRKLRCLVTRDENFSETLRSTSAGLRSDGTDFPAEVTMKSMMVKGRLLFTFFIRDITALQQAIEDRREMEGRLLQSQKLEALGTLAGGIAHDFNNIITAIMGYTELSLRAASDECQTKYLDNILLSTTRARDLVKQLLAFSRKGMETCEPVQVSMIVKEVIKLLRAGLPATVEIRQHIEDDTCIISSSPTRIHQVLMNLCTNAAHAIAGTGSIEIFLEPVDLDEVQIRQYADVRPGPYVKLSVRDSGAGISPEIMPRIFEPFFTTKEGLGTGMGLAVVHGIVKSHGGDILVESQPGKGSTFDILLPRIEMTALKKPCRENFLPNGTERILLIDDEKALVDLWQEQFASLGYTIAGLQSSLDALTVFQNDPAAFDLVITDMTMPVMPGDMLAEEILKIRPGMPIIICTGYSDKISEKRVKELGVTVVMKPMLVNEIIKVMRDVLNPFTAARRD